MTPITQHLKARQLAVKENKPYSQGIIDFLTANGAKPLQFGHYATTFKTPDNNVLAVVFTADDATKDFLTRLPPHPHLPEIKTVYKGKCGATIYRMPYYDVIHPDNMSHAQLDIFEDLNTIQALHKDDFTDTAEYPLNYYFPNLTPDILEGLWLIVSNMPEVVNFDFKWFNVGWQGDTVILLDPFQS